MRCTTKQTRSAFGWKTHTPPAEVRCARNTSLGARLRAVQTTCDSDSEEHVHERATEAHWLRSFLTELFAAGDILPSKRR